MIDEKPQRDPDQLKLLLRLPQDEYGYPPYTIERLWVSPREDGTYEIDNIPFFSYDVAVGDIVRAEEEDGDLFFEEVVQASGNSVIRVKLRAEAERTPLYAELQALGCDAEAFGTLVAVNIPAQVAYEPVLTFLTQGQEDDRWGVEEALIRSPARLEELGLCATSR